MPRIALLPALALAVALLAAALSGGTSPARADSLGPTPPHEALCVPGGNCTAALVALNDGDTVEISDGQYIHLTWDNTPRQPLLPPNSLITDVVLTIRAMETDPDVGIYLRNGDDTSTLALVTDWLPSGYVTHDIRNSNLTSYIRDQLQAGVDLQLRLIAFAESSPPAAIAIDYAALSITYTPGVSPTPQPGQERVVELVPGRCNPISITHLAGTLTQTVAMGLEPPALESLEAFWRYNPFLNRFVGWSPRAPTAANDLISVEAFLEVWFACIRDVPGPVTITMPAVG